MTDEEAKKRLLAYTAVRALGIAIFLFGVAAMYTGVLRTGGWPQAGAIIAILGVIDALLMPHFLKRAWDNRDREQQ